MGDYMAVSLSGITLSVQQAARVFGPDFARHLARWRARNWPDQEYQVHLLLSQVHDAG